MNNEGRPASGGPSAAPPPPQPVNVVKLSATDVLAPTTMKNAAKCDTSCDLQNPVNHRNFERILRFRDMPGSMLVGVSVDTTRPSLLWGGGADSACSGARAPSAPKLLNCSNPVVASRCRGGAFSSKNNPRRTELLTARRLGDTTLDSARASWGVN